MDALLLLDRYVKACEAKGLAAETIRYRRDYVRHFIAWRRGSDLRSLTSDEMIAYAHELALYRYRQSKAEAAPWKLLTNRTREQRLWIIGDFLQWLVEHHVILVNPFHRVRAKPLPKRLPARIPTESEIERILAAASGTRSDVERRNRAIIELMYSTAMRIAEAAAIDTTDLDLTAGTLLIRHGKGGRSRVVPIGEAATSALLDYLQHTRPGFVSSKPGVAALFLAATHCGTTGQRLSKASIREIVREAGRKAGIDRRINPHQIRHACATHMLRAGADLRHIQQLLGHSRIDTTEIYTQVDASDLANVLARTHPRFRARQRSG